MQKLTYLICKFESGMGRSKYPVAMHNGNIEFVNQKLQEFNKTGNDNQYLTITRFVDGEQDGDGYTQSWTGDMTAEEISDLVAELGTSIQELQLMCIRGIEPSWTELGKMRRRMGR